MMTPQEYFSLRMLAGPRIMTDREIAVLRRALRRSVKVRDEGVTAGTSSATNSTTTPTE